MNEPSMFNGPEITFHKDVLHLNGYEHRHVHNMYGLSLVKSTYMGHLQRSNNEKRPFVLTRSTFVGSQRYGNNKIIVEYISANSIFRINFFGFRNFYFENLKNNFEILVSNLPILHFFSNFAKFRKFRIKFKIYLIFF
jgi:hypothetical protein